MTHPLLIIGAGLAGWTTAREFRKLDTQTPILLVTADSGDFYAKPSLSNALVQKRGPAQLVSTLAAKMSESLQVTLLPHTRVTALHPLTRSISTSQGDFSYSQLVLATGAQPIRVPVAGDAATQVLSINSLDDFAVFHARLTQPKPDGTPVRVLIMGAGLIGCEFANDLAASGYAVTVVDPAAAPIAALLPPDASHQLRDALGALGVNWHWGATVKAVHHASPDAGVALQVELSTGLQVPADLVLSAIGLRADTQLAQAAGLVCERGVQVDACLQTSAPHIFSLGDSAQYGPGRWDAEAAPGSLPRQPTGGSTLPYVMPIMSAAKALAATLAGQRTEVVFPLMPVAVKTPALPMVVAPPAPGTPGQWLHAEPGLWQFNDAQGLRRGFVLTGAQTPRRGEQSKLVVA
jgi:rubredoxin-NAD+ reductase